MTGFYRNHTLIFSTIFLTGTGIFSRILGFFYRIFLSRTIGAEGLGIYQMIFPVFGICFSLCAGSIQTAISRFTAADQKHGTKTLTCGLLISLSISLVLSALIGNFSEFLAVHILMEPKCAPLLPALALALPFTALHACICGYFYGKEQVQIPAIAQLLEQCVRIFTVFIVVDIRQSQGYEITAQAAVWGLLAGEALSSLFVLLMFFIYRSPKQEEDRILHSHSLPMLQSLKNTAGPLMALAAPLMANRLVMNLLQSLEAIMIPQQLEQFGLTGSQAVSIYGVLTGMALPFILFPSAIVNSLAVVLLPTVARQQALGNDSGIIKNLSLSVRCCLYMGILCVGVFTVFGNDLGMCVFQDPDAGTFITILAWLCPFLYLATALGSVLNGLGKTTVNFIHHLITSSIRLAFVFFGIPRFGILAFLWGMLISEVLVMFLHYFSVKKLTSFIPNVWEVLVKPIFCLFMALEIYRLFPDIDILFPSWPEFFQIALPIGLISICYFLLLLLLAKKDL